MSTKKISSAKSNGRVELVDNKLVIKGKIPYQLPSHLDSKFLEAFLSSTPEDEVFIGDVLHSVLPGERKRMYEACKSIGGNTWDLYKAVAKKWVSVINNDDKWNLDHYRIIYDVEVGAPYIERIAISDGNFRFVITPMGTFSYAEFKWRFQQDVGEHIEAFKQTKISNLDVIMACATATIISKYCIVYTKDGVKKQLCVGLDSQPPERWKMPDGVQFLSEDSTDDYT
jgi:hypothetical protein